MASRGTQARAIPYLFSLPALFLILALLLLPMLISLGLSLTDYTLGAPEVDFVWFENFERIFTRSTYMKMLSATFWYVIIVVPGSVALGLGAALLINSLTVGKGFYRTVFFLPVMATLVAMAMVWEFMLHPTLGIVNEGLEGLCAVPGITAIGFFETGCADGFPHWLGERETALWVLCFIGIWQAVGFNMVLYMAGLTAIPRELYNAASVDGADSAWDRFRLVTWPMLGPTNVFVLTITAIRSFQAFDTVDMLTEGGPSKSTYVIMYAIFEKGVQQNLIGVGTAITVLFMAFVFLLTFLQRYLVERRVHYA